MEDDERARQSEIARLRDAGTSWREIQQQFNLTRQQARYAYQLGKRAERRAERDARRSEDAGQ